MNLVDSCGWLEYFADGPNAGFFAPAIENHSKLIVPSICILEVYKRTLQQCDDNKAILTVASMLCGKVIDMDRDIALFAAKLGFQLKLPLADSIILATAKRNNATIWTSDTDFKDIDGVKFTAKKNR